MSYPLLLKCLSLSLSLPLSPSLSLHCDDILGVIFTLVLDAVPQRSESLKFGKQNTEDTGFDDAFIEK
jgi:hypothetical protein